MASRAGIPNKDKVELRALCQDTVMEYTDLLRDRLQDQARADGRELSRADLDASQPQYDEWDPVVSLALIAVDHRNSPELRRQANSDAAQYLRPKLSAIKITEDAESIALQAEKNKLAGRMVDILDAMEQARREG